MADTPPLELRLQPDGITLRVPPGTSLTRAAVDAGVPLELPCGGLGQCGQCKVKITRGLNGPDLDETRLLTEHQLAEGIRLACRQQVDVPMTVELGDQVRSKANQIMVGGDVRATQLDSGVEQLVVDIDRAPLGDERDDWSRLEQAANRTIESTLPAIRQLYSAIGEGGGAVTCHLHAGRCLTIRPGKPAAAPLGFAVDIGTTTIVVYLLDLAQGGELGHAAMLNPQVAYGDDVIARIHHVGVEPKGLGTLQREVRRAIDELLGRVCEETGRDTADVVRGTIVGNATMTHLFCGIDPTGLGLAPFAPVTHATITTDGAAFGLRSAAEAVVTVLPNIAGFLGSDTVGVMLAAMPEPTATTLAVDIGTNGEMILFHDGRWYGCSAAAGPAFEGARIGCGMRGAAGAISGVDYVDGEVRLAVIDHQPPRGLCGSGLLDAIAALLESGALDETGRLAEPGDGPLGDRISGDGPERRFELASAAESATDEPLYLTAADIREVQLAKGSIRASIEALLARAGVTAAEVETVYLAGGFGSYLRVPSAIRVGLLPSFDPARVHAIGNGAGAGARLALMSRTELALAERLARRVEVLYLAHDPVYQMQFMEQMMFPAG